MATVRERAAGRTNPQQAPTPAPILEPNTNDVGLFVSTTPIGYLEPNAEVAKRILSHVQALTKEVSRHFLQDLLTIKMLVPEESKDLVIYNVPMAVDFIGRLREQLVMKYYQEGV